MTSTKAMTTELELTLLNHAFPLYMDNSVSNRRSNCSPLTEFSIARPSSIAATKNFGRDARATERNDPPPAHQSPQVSRGSRPRPPSARTAGGGPGSYEVKAQLPDITNIQQNSRGRVGDVTVGNDTKIEREGWHSLLTTRLDGNVDLPASAIATNGQTSLLGSLRVELAPPTVVSPEGKLCNGSLIPSRRRRKSQE
jgi:hypothetical protein